jgi:cell division protein FtsA
MLRYAVDTAERAAGVHVDSVVLPITAGPHRERAVRRDRAHEDPDREQCGYRARARRRQPPFGARGSRRAAFAPIGYALDDTAAFAIQRGMVGQRLGVDMHVATTDVAAARNLTLLVERCHIGVEAMVRAPYVSGLAVMAEDEADLGAAVIDLGAGTTTIAVFSEGRFVHVGGFAVGGLHVTMDIARGLTTTISDAERLKTLFGAALSGPSDDRDMISLATADGRSARSPAHDPARAAGAHHPPAGGGNPRNGARRARQVAVRRRSARPRHSRRRRQPDDRPLRSRGADPRAAGAQSGARSASEA